MTLPLRETAARAATAATILSLALMAAPSVAHATDLSSGSAPLVLAQYVAPQSAPKAPLPQQIAAVPKIAPGTRVEARIKDLHDKLRITTAQSAQWESVAQVMRTNATMMRDSMTQRSTKAKGMTAMDDLRSYEMVAQAHTDGLSKFIPVFATLYDGMPTEQKKNADVVFARFEHHAAPKASKTN